MKKPEEMARYTLKNMGPLREWYNLEYKNAKRKLDQWLKVAKPDDMSGNELIRAFALYDLEGQVVTYNYMLGLTECREEFSQPLMLVALDLVLQEMGHRMTEQMHTEHPNLRRTHKIIMRANRMGECIMYIGPTTAVLADGRIRYAEEKIFADGGTFMTQGSEGCLAMLRG